MERKVLILTDGKAGHENQSKAFARALGCDFDLVEIHFKSAFHKAFSYLFDHLGIHTLSLFAKHAPFPSSDYASVIGTGSGTFYAAKSLARKLGATCGVVLYPRGYRIASFDCVLAPTFDRPAPAPNVIPIPVNLVASDEAFYAAGTETFRARYSPSEKPAVAVIVGGPNKCSTMSADWMKAQLEKLFADSPDSEHWVTTSRRTPADVESVVDSFPFDYKLLYSKDHFNPIPAFVKLARTLYVTAESTGMISESCTFGTAEVRVMDNLNPGPHKFRRFVEDLERGGYVNGARKVDLSEQFNLARQLLHHEKKGPTMTDTAKQTLSMPLGLRLKLSAMMFLQFMTLPVWFNTVIPYVKTLPGGESWVLWCGMFIGFGTLASPIVGMFADRFMNAEKVLALTHLAYAGLLAVCFFVRDPAVLFTLLLFACFVNMPGWSLTATIAMTHSTPAAFPHIRVFGSLGWVASAVFSVVGIRFFGIADFDTSPWIFACAATTGLLGAVVACTLPSTPPRACNTPMSLADAFGLKAFTLFKDPKFLAFGLLLAFSMIPFQWYMNYNALYLKESGFTYLTLTQNLGQVGELAFMAALPFILRICGYKWSMVIGLSLLAIRYACFYASVKLGCPAFDFAGILLHGSVFGLIIVNSQMYVLEVAPPELRNQAQGLTMTLTGSAGVFVSVTIFNRVLAANVRADGMHDWAPPYLLAFGMSVVLAVLTALLFKPANQQAFRQ